MHFIQWHHIFPKSLLKKHGFETGEINEVANMAFITGLTNQRISSKEPSVYLPEIVEKQGAAALKSQLVPVLPALWHLESYREFLEVCREGLAKRMNEFIAEMAGL